MIWSCGSGCTGDWISNVHQFNAEDYVGVLDRARGQLCL
jgi:hypothetical protein